MGATNGVDGGEKSSCRSLPDAKTLQEAGELKIKDDKGNEIPLKSLYTGKGDNERQLIIFVRHFFCGSCEEYIRAVVKEFPPAALAAIQTSITFIGCGDPVCIPDYKARTFCPYDLYADPSRKIYDKLGMMSTLRGSKEKPEYISKSMMGVVLSSTWNALSRPSQTLKGGPSSQNGGEWLFQAGEVKWCHRMENTTGHVEVKELKEVLGV